MGRPKKIKVDNLESVEIKKTNRVKKIEEPVLIEEKTEVIKENKFLKWFDNKQSNKKIMFDYAKSSTLTNLIFKHGANTKSSIMQYGGKLHISNKKNRCIYFYSKNFFQQSSKTILKYVPNEQDNDVFVMESGKIYSSTYNYGITQPILIKKDGSAHFTNPVSIMMNDPKYIIKSTNIIDILLYLFYNIGSSDTTMDKYVNYFRNTNIIHQLFINNDLVYKGELTQVYPFSLEMNLIFEDNISEDIKKQSIDHLASILNTIFIIEYNSNKRDKELLEDIQLIQNLFKSKYNKIIKTTNTSNEKTQLLFDMIQSLFITPCKKFTNDKNTPYNIYDTSSYAYWLLVQKTFKYKQTGVWFYVKDRNKLVYLNNEYTGFPVQTKLLPVIHTNDDYMVRINKHSEHLLNKINKYNMVVSINTLGPMQKEMSRNFLNILLSENNNKLCFCYNNSDKKTAKMEPVLVNKNNIDVVLNQYQEIYLEVNIPAIMDSVEIKAMNAKYSISDQLNFNILFGLLNKIKSQHYIKTFEITNVNLLNLNSKTTDFSIYLEFNDDLDNKNHQLLFNMLNNILVLPD